MKNIIKFVSIFGILAILLIGYSGSTNARGLGGFLERIHHDINADIATNAVNIGINASGNSANADDIANLGSGAGGTPNYSGYSTPF